LKALEQKQLIEASEPVLATASTESFAAPTLSPAQTDTAAQLPDPAQGFSACLLYGITGSGKTEIYLHYLKQHLGENTPRRTGYTYRHPFGGFAALYRLAHADCG